MPTVKFNHKDLAKIQARFGINYSNKLLDTIGDIGCSVEENNSNEYCREYRYAAKYNRPCCSHGWWAAAELHEPSAHSSRQKRLDFFTSIAVQQILRL